MPASHSEKLAPQPRELPFLDRLVLSRIACDRGATGSEVVRDLGGLAAAALTPGEWRRSAGDAIAALTAAQLAVESKGRMLATPAGMAVIARWLGQPADGPPAWPEQRDTRLLGKALLGESANVPPPRAALGLGGLRAAIVQGAFGLPLKPAQPPASLRSQLAVVALERAFGARVKASLGHGRGLPARTARALAGELLARPRDFATDARLLAALAAEQVGSPGGGLNALRGAVLKRYAARGLGQPTAESPPLDTGEPRQPVRPNLRALVAEVQAAARDRAEGWSGNRKAFISHVWQAIRGGQRGDRLSEAEFKSMLTDAHRAGLLVLATADLKDKRRMREIEDSAVPYKNTVWHYIRVDE